MPVNTNLSFRLVVCVQIPTNSYFELELILKEILSSIFWAQIALFQIPCEFKTTWVFEITISLPPSENSALSFQVRSYRGGEGRRLMLRYLSPRTLVFMILRWEN